jgi:hypothetical protein
VDDPAARDWADAVAAGLSAIDVTCGSTTTGFAARLASWGRLTVGAITTTGAIKTDDSTVAVSLRITNLTSGRAITGFSRPKRLL